MYNRSSYYSSSHYPQQYSSYGHGGYYPPPHSSRNHFAYQNYRNYSLAPSQISSKTTHSGHRGVTSNGQAKVDEEEKKASKWWKRQEDDDEYGKSWRVSEQRRLDAVDGTGSDELWAADKANRVVEDLTIGDIGDDEMSTKSATK